MLRRAFSLAAVALALLAGGCGGEDRLSREEYQQELNQTDDELEQAFQGFTSELEEVAGGQGSLDEAGQEVGKIQEQLDRSADELDDLAPPEDAEAAHDDLVEGMRGLSDDLEEFQQAIESGDVREVQEFARKAEQLDSVQTLERASRRLEEQGYELGDEGGG